MATHEERLDRDCQTIRDLIDNIDSSIFKNTAISLKTNDRLISVTYKELQDTVKSLGTILIKMGIKKGQKVGIWSVNRPEWSIAYLAVASIGAVIVPLDIFMGMDDSLLAVENSDMKYIFTSEAFLEPAVEIRKKCRKLQKIICFDEHPMIDAEVVAKIKMADKKKFNLVNHALLEKTPFKNLKMLNYTTLIKTGSKILDKGGRTYKNRVPLPEDIISLIYMHNDVLVSLSHKAVMSNCYAFLRRLLPDGYLNQKDVCVGALPFHHTYPTLAQIIAPIICEAQVAICSTPKIQETLSVIKEFNARIFSTVPLILKQMLAEVSKNPELLKSIKYIIVAGACLHKYLVEAYGKLGVKVLNGYGLSEYAPIVSWNTPDLNHAGSVGYALDNVCVKIDSIDEKGNGELLVKGPSMMSEYYKNPKETSKVLDARGWLHTGDIVRIDQKGRIFITGRKRKLIVNMGGKNIYTDQIEQQLLKSKYIANVRVIAKIDKEKGEYPYAIIRPDMENLEKPDRTTKNENVEKDIKRTIKREIKRLMSKFAGYKEPRTFEIVYNEDCFEETDQNIMMFEDIYMSESLEKIEDSTTPSSIGNKDIIKKLQKDLKLIAAEIFDIEVNRITFDIPLDEAGLSSVELTSLSNVLSQKYNIQITPADFFDIGEQSISSIAEYLCCEYEDTFFSYYYDEIKENETIGVSQCGNSLQKNIISNCENNYLKNCTEKLQKRAPLNKKEDFAVIGMNGVFPQSKDLDTFWHNLINEKDLIKRIPEDRWDYEGMHKADCKVKWGGFIPDVDKFDPMFFGISPREAETMDPQQRISMEVVWKTIEDAGYKASDFFGANIGVFFGVTTSDYWDIVRKSRSATDSHAASGCVHSIIPNRISYLLNLHGPSEAIDTACSSSLVAIHRAVRSMQSGDCEMAIAGGVNVILDPLFGMIFDNSGVVAGDGRCKTFDNNGDGYVRGEGAGAIFLKPLLQAERDGDNIYGVIKAVSVNHGGKANSLMAPNAKAQADMIIKAYQEACIPPDTVSYIETHGTGTVLGDPIEVNGLKRAFKSLYEQNNLKAPEKPHCALGSVKTNIGHLESAAGIAGVIRVLLSMKYKMLTKTLHFKTLNKYIDLKGTPFFISDKTKSWESLKNSDGHSLARIAGVSSFGFGGANAHVVLEEYNCQASTRNQKIPSQPQVFVLSAKNENRLRVYAIQLIMFLQKNSGCDLSYQPQIELANVAFTLQTGREEMQVRLAIIANSIKTLIEKLKAYVNKNNNVENLYTGSAKNDDQKRNIIMEDEDVKDLVNKWVNNGKLSNIAALWVEGAKIDWIVLHKGGMPKRTSLPTYPFSRDRYWVSKRSKEKKENLPIHPLLDKLTVKLPSQGVTFTKRMNCDSLILKDHQVHDDKIFPGVGILEMAYAAFAYLSGDKSFVLRRTVWLRPLSVNCGFRDIRILIKDTNDKVFWQFVTDTEEQEILHAQGEYYLCEKRTEDLTEILQVKEIVKSCAEKIDKNTIYEAFSEIGVAYGRYFQGLERIWISRNEAVGRIVLNDHISKELDDYILHPSIMDTAFQTISAFIVFIGKEKKGDPLLPFAIEEIEYRHPLKSSMYSYVKALGDFKYHIALVDDTGLICAKVHGVTIKPLKAYPKLIPEKKSEPEMHYTRCWIPRPLKEKDHQAEDEKEIKSSILIVNPANTAGLSDVLFKIYGDRAIRILLGDKSKLNSQSDFEINVNQALALDDCIAQIKDRNIDTIYFLGGVVPQEKDGTDLSTLKQIQTFGVLSLFRLVKSLSKYGYLKRALTLKVVTNEVHTIDDKAIPNPYSAGVFGMTKSMVKEYPMLKVSCIDIELNEIKNKKQKDPLAETAKHIIAEPGNKSGKDIVIRNGLRHVFKLNSIDLPSVDGTAFRENGVYVILGGAGGIGFELSKFLAKEVSARLVLLGRSEIGKKQRDMLEQLKSYDAKAIYLQADATNFDSMAAAIKITKETYGEINGVVHSALDLQDQVLEFMSEEKLKASLGAKVTGSVILYKVLQNEKLDFMMFISSVLSIFGNAGQSNYAAGSTFQDGFAEYLSKKQDYPVISINWGFWGTVGRVASKDYVQRMAAIGVQSIEPEEAMDTISRVVGNGIKRIVVFKAHNINYFNFPGAAESTSNTTGKMVRTYKDRIAENAVDEMGRNILEAQAQLEPLLADTPNEMHEKELDKITNEYAKNVFSQALRLDKSVIENDVTFERYGVDSLTGMQVIRLFEKDLGDLPATLLYENVTIKLLSKYFIEHHKDKLIKKYASQKKQTLVSFLSEKDRNKIFTDRAKTLLKTENMSDDRSLKVVTDNENKDRRSVSCKSYYDQPIAVIGLSGRYPRAKNIENFWFNLKNGVNCIGEVPEERWSWKEYEKQGISKWGGFVDDADKFDPLFFNISPKEAEGMDPQERLFLETVWTVMEDAGYTRRDLTKVDNNVGVFVGIMNCSYEYLGAEARMRGIQTNAHSYYWSVANRISYFFDFQGPSITLDTACSSSMTAIHLACESIKRGECKYSIAGGVNLILHPKHFIELSMMNMLTKDKKCKAFGHGADGFVAGEGVGAVLLKPLDKARQDGDQIYGIIKGTSINAGGKTSGYTVPNPNAQADIILKSLDKAGVNARTISYIEAHGTGTSLGDPIEIAGLKKAFKSHTEDKKFCSIGSVKTNIGHLESSAGIAGLTKVLLQMKHKKIVPSLHAILPNPNIDFTNTPFFIQQGLTDWKQPFLSIENADRYYPRRAGISSFGAGGANAHIVIEENNHKDARKSLVFMFSGVGEHYTGMGRKLYENDKIFRQCVDQCCEIMRNKMQKDLLSVLYPDDSKAEKRPKENSNNSLLFNKIVHRRKESDIRDQKVINQPIISHPVMFIVEYALANSLLSRDIHPDAMIGESLGEYVAACLSGVITLEDALLLVYERSRLIQQSPPGAMSVVLMSEQEITPLLNEELSLAVINTQHICVVSGTPGAIEDLEAKLHEMGTVSRRLPIYHAFHSNTLKSIRNEFMVTLQKIDFKEPNIPYLSNVTGTWITAEQTKNPEYWMAHTCKTVRFYDGIRELLSDPERIFIEIGPGKSLSSFVMQTTDSKATSDQFVFQTLPSSDEKLDDEVYFKDNKDKIEMFYEKSKEPQIILLSAKNEERLKAYAHDMLLYLNNEYENNDSKDFICSELEHAEKFSVDYQASLSVSLQDIAYTLQVGRESMNERLAIIVSDIDELKMYLEDFLKGKTETENIFKANIKTNGFDVELLVDGQEGIEYIQKIVTNRNYAKLAKLWVSGVDIDWRVIHSPGFPKRISLPTYPFARERYWIRENEGLGYKNTQVDQQKDIILKEAGANEPDKSNTGTIKSYKNRNGLLECAIGYLKSVIAPLIELEPDRIEETEKLETYGIDSVIIGKLNIEFETIFEKLPKTLLFTYKNIKSLAGYFVENHEAVIRELFSEQKSGNGGNKNVKASENGKIINRNETSNQKKIEVISNSVQNGKRRCADEDIAIIGLSGIYPMAENIEEFWINLKNGRDCIVEIPRKRWDLKKYYNPVKNTPGKMYTKWGGFIDDFDNFDPLFFGISPLTAQNMDPQERLFLQVAWSCLEDAGYTPKLLEDELAGDCRANIGVFAGVTFNEYPFHGAQEWARGYAMPVSSQIFSVANRVSYTFNFSGPSLSVDTACSSSLYALHLACESIRNKECKAAITGGVNLTLHPNKFIISSSLSFAASDGRCHAFGEGGDGYVAGEGVGAVFLKPLTDALKDRDHIYAVLKGTATNHNGKTNGYTVPNPVAQAEVISTALRKSKINPGTISYVEAHGTGTSLGDPIEINGLSEAFFVSANAKQYCKIGSVKSNIGHLESAAGISQLTKVILQMKHKKIVPSLLHSDKLNPNIDFENSPFIVQRELEEWKRPVIEKHGAGQIVPRRAGISSFGAGGVNVHVIVEEFENNSKLEQASDLGSGKISMDKEYKNENEVLIVLSAKSESSLDKYVEQLLVFLKNKKHDGNFLENMAYTLQVGRDAMPYRLAFTACNIEEIVKKLKICIGNNNKKIRKKFFEAGIFNGYSSPISGNLKKHDVPTENQEYLNHIIQNKKLLKLAKIWVNGAVFNWHDLNSENRPRRVSLPTYAFEKQRYWYADSSSMFEIENNKDAKESQQNKVDINENAEKSAIPENPNLIEASDSFLSDLARKHGSERNEAVTVRLQKMLAKVLGFSEDHLPKADYGLFDMGMESMQAVTFMENISKQFKVDIYPTIVFDYPNIGQLTEYIMQNISSSDVLQPNDEHKYDSNTGTQAINRSEEIECILLNTVWKKRDLISKYDTSKTTDKILIIDDNDRLYNLIYKKSPNNVVLIIKGEKYMDIGNNIFRLNPKGEKDYDQLLNVLKQKYFVPDKIIYKCNNGSSVSTIDPLCNRINDSLISLFHIIKAIINLNLQKKLEIFCIYYENSESIQPHYAALSGFIKSIMQENQKIISKLIAINKVLNTKSKTNNCNKQLLDMIYNESLREDRNEVEIRYDESNKRFVKYLEKINEDKIINIYPSGQKPVSFKKNGVYLITGGIGGVGLIFANYLAKTYNAKLVLCGRSDLSREKEYKINSLRSLGAEVFYQKADISRQEDVKTLIAASKAEFSQINGIIHSAGIVKDANIQNKTAKQIEAVIAPKVWGSINLDEATKDEDLDCFIIFSSVVALMGNIGQADYAYANSFMDQFALEREDMVKKNLRKGKTVSINWPIWREGGMKVSAFIEDYLNKTFGLKSIEKEEGIAVLEDAIKSRRVQTALLKGDKVKMNRFLESFSYNEYADDEKKQRADRCLLPEKIIKDQIDIQINYSGEKEIKQNLVSMIERVNSDFGLNL